MAVTAPTPAPIGAVVRALAELRCESAATRTTLLQAMGWSAAAPEALPLPVSVLVPEPPTEARKPPPSPKPAEERQALPSELTPLATAAAEEPAWLKNAEPLPLPDPRRAVPLYAKPIEPLFPPQITRAILTRLASAPVPVGEVEIGRLVDTIAMGQPLTTLPRRTVPTLAKGLELLIDDGCGLDPFVHDVAGLIDDLALAVGRDRLTIWLFRGCPTDGVMNPETAAVTSYRPPPGGTPVLTITDLGVAERRRARVPIAEGDWLQFAAELRARGTKLAVLIPSSPTRLPAALRRALAPIVWDRSTGARLGAPLADRGQAA